MEANKDKLMAITKTVLKRTNLRFYPTKSQEVLLSQAFGNSRFIWNYYTYIFRNKEIDNKNKIYPTIKELKEKYNFDFLKLSPSCCQQQTIRHFQSTLKQFFNKKRKSKLGRPKFKKKGVSKDSIAFSGSGIYTNKNNEIRLVGLGKIKLRGEIDLNSLDRNKIKSITISKDKCNHYYASICHEVEIEITERDFKLKNKSIGLDLGLAHFLIDSQGKKVENPKFLKQELEKLKYLDRCLSRKTKNSNSYKKCKLKRAKLFKSITNKRNYFFHCISKNLIENFDFIYIEDLSIKNMIKNKHISSTSDFLS